MKRPKRPPATPTPPPPSPLMSTDQSPVREIAIRELRRQKIDLIDKQLRSICNRVVASKSLKEIDDALWEVVTLCLLLITEARES